MTLLFRRRWIEVGIVQGRFDGAARLGAAVSIPRQIAADATHPGREAGLPPKSIQPPIDSNVGVLKDLAGVVVVSEQAHQESVETVLGRGDSECIRSAPVPVRPLPADVFGNVRRPVLEPLFAQ